MVQQTTQDPLEIQRQIRNILIANSEWLIQEANNPEHHSWLNGLLNQAWFSTEAKLSLYEELLYSAAEASVAHNYFSNLLKILTPSPTKKAASYCQIRA